jgi:hypothetical protein
LKVGALLPLRRVRATLRGVSERFWRNRLRWRLRGAMQWPAFVFFTLADAFVLDALPPITTTGVDSGLNFVEGLLIATFGNLFLVGAAAPFLARRLAARRQAAVGGVEGGEPSQEPGLADVDREVLQDRIATALLVAGLVATFVAGLANRQVIVSETDATEAAGRAVLDYVETSGDEELRRNVETANIKRLGDDFFRICIARDDRERFFCLLVDTDSDPPEVTKDPSAEPNSVYRGG